MLKRVGADSLRREHHMVFDTSRKCKKKMLDAWLPELLEAKVAAHWRIPNSLKPAMSINKAQGQSLKIAGIDLEQPCFSHGQLYVACSRVGSGRNLCFGSRK
ncbi:hypothetical protein LAZ67_15000211 [Cordylochernes scorpioides]|uniref:Uncharacterized protein n=1 Tax=Cordylochernes scorpioides TaxID=51811 RepID=A0ABY6L7W2_9ARAC|nr:hypothetical protein LAZ67_15000211 [Cordylochernes scorpioides]